MHSIGTVDPGQAGEDVTRALPSQWGLPTQLDQNGGLLALGTRAAHTCRHYILLEALEGEVCFTKISNSPSLLQVHFLPRMNTVLYVPCNQLTTSPLLATHISHLSIQFSSVAQSCPTLRPRELQHARPPCPLPTPEVYPNSCPLSR